MGKLAPGRPDGQKLDQQEMGGKPRHVRHADFAEGLCPPAAGLVETLAVFKTRTGRFLVYYIVVYPELEYQTPRQEYARLCPDADALRAFLAAMSANRVSALKALTSASMKWRSKLKVSALMP